MGLVVRLHGRCQPSRRVCPPPDQLLHLLICNLYTPRYQGCHEPPHYSTISTQQPACASPFASIQGRKASTGRVTELSQRHHRLGSKSQIPAFIAATQSSSQQHLRNQQAWGSTFARIGEGRLQGVGELLVDEGEGGPGRARVQVQLDGPVHLRCALTLPPHRRHQRVLLLRVAHKPLQRPCTRTPTRQTVIRNFPLLTLAVKLFIGYLLAARVARVLESSLLVHTVRKCCREHCAILL
jgi:hypothetical protein